MSRRVDAPPPSFRRSTSTATIVRAPASRAPATAAVPTPPQPKTATVSPRVTPPVLIAAPIPAITPQPSSPAAVAGAAGSTFVHCAAATSVFSARAPMPSAGVSDGAVGERHPLGRVVGGEAVPGTAAGAGAAAAADGAPVQDHEVPGRDVGDAGADRADPAGRLVPEQERVVVGDPALPVVQIGVADAARLDVDHRLARAGIRHQHRLDPDRLAPAPRHHCTHLDRHVASRRRVPTWNRTDPQPAAEIAPVPRSRRRRLPPVSRRAVREFGP